MSVINFLFKNHFKGLTIKAYIYSAIYRVFILTRDSNKMKTLWGIEGAETPYETFSSDEIKVIKRVSLSVNKVCDKTKWESKCLVRALTAQRLLKEKGIPTTLYLGCGLEQDKMVAHAWIRAGQIYVTGGDGTGYAVVDSFAQF